MKKILLMLAAVCYAAVMQAEVVFHPQAEPTPAQRGFTQDLWEDTETGRVYADQACTQELNAAVVVSYATLGVDPIVSKKDFTAKEQGTYANTVFDWVGETTYTQSYTGVRSVSFRVYGMGAGDARLKWHKHHTRYVFEQFSVTISVNGEEVYSDLDKAEDMDGLYAVPLPGLKYDDVVKFEVNRYGAGYDIDDSTWGDITLAACLEYTRLSEGQQPLTITAHDKVKFAGCTDPELTWSVTQGTVDPNHPLESIMISREAGEAAGSYTISVANETLGSNPTYDITFVDGTLRIISGEHHAQADAHPAHPGYAVECWEDTETHQLYADTYCAEPLNPAEVVTYLPLAAGPAVVTDGFEAKESATYSGSNYSFNWLAETSYRENETGTHSAEFTIDAKGVEHARLKWYKDMGNYNYGQFTVNVYVNGKLVSTANQDDRETLEGLSSVALPEVKQGDVVRFETVKPSTSNWKGTVTLAACMEYTCITFLSIKADDKTKMVGFEADPELTWSIAEGAVFDGWPLQDITLSREAGEAVGSYTISAEAGVNGNNSFYDIHCVDGTLSILDGEHHTPIAPHTLAIGYAQECWEVSETHQLYADPYCTEPLNPAEVVTYQPLTVGPAIVTDGFTAKESKTYSDKNYPFNWLAETSYSHEETGTRSAEFTIGVKHVEHARLKWYKDMGNYQYGQFAVSVFVNGTLVSTLNQDHEETLEGVYAVALPDLEQGDVVKFEVSRAAMSYKVGTVTLAACLEYTTTTSHTQCEPTVRTVGYAQNCIEEHLTGKWYAADTFEELHPGCVVTYAMDATSFIGGNPFYYTVGREEVYLGASFSNHALGFVKNVKNDETPYADFLVNGVDIADARLKWYVDHVNQTFTLNVYVNGELVKSYKQPDDTYSGNKHLEVTPLDGLKSSDVVRLEVVSDTQDNDLFLAVCLEYTKADVETHRLVITADNKVKAVGEADPKLTWTITEGTLFDGDVLEDITLSREPGEDAGVYAIHVSQSRGANPGYAIQFVCGELRAFVGTVHRQSEPTVEAFGYAQDCVEETATGHLYDLATSAELNPAQAIVYARLPLNPFYNTNAEDDVTFKESADYLGSRFNWVYETTFEAEAAGIRSIKFRVSGNKVSNARLVWYKHQEDVCIDAFDIRVYVNNAQYASYDHSFQRETDLEALGVGLLPTVKDGDIVEVKVNKEYTYSCTGAFTLALSLEYNYSAEDEEIGSLGDDITYTWDYTTGEVTITGTGKMYDFNDDFKSPFYNSPIKSVTIGEGITTIGNGVFSGCSQVTAIDLPSGIERIGDHAFENMTSLEAIVLPAGVTSVGEYAFSGCTALYSVELPSGVSAVGDWAFSGCANLGCIRSEAEPPAVGTNTFKSVSTQICVLQVPEEYLEAYMTAEVWKDFKYTVKYDPEEDTIIAGQMGENVYYEWNVITGHVRIYGTGPTYNFGYKESPMYEKAIRSVTVEEGVTYLGNQCFAYCGLLLSAELPSSIESIGWQLFEFCHSLKSVTLPSDLQVLPYQTFYYCDALESVELPQGLTTIESSVFHFCKKIREIIVPSSVTSIGSYAFVYCEAMKHLQLSPNMTEIPDFMCTNCIALETIDIPYGIESIGSDAFGMVPNLQVLKIPSSVTSFNESAFSQCNRLLAVYMDMAPLNAKREVFRGADKDACVLYVPQGYGDAYRQADYWKDFKNIVEYPFTVIMANEDPDNEGVYYTTFYDGQSEYTLGEGATAYTGSVVGDELRLTAISDGIIPKGEAVLIRAEKADVQITASSTGAVKSASNVLLGTDIPLPAPADSYIFTYAQHGLGFYSFAEGRYLSPHKAYIVVGNQPAGARLSMVFPDDEHEAIEHVEADAPAHADIYSLGGVRQNTLQPGLNIVNGRKVLIQK